MIIRIFILSFILVASVLKTDATPSFYLKCLKDIYAKVHLNLPDTLGCDINNDSTWKYSGKPLRICTNNYGDISHIGYKLFHSDVVKSSQTRAVLLFIERLALDYDLFLKEATPDTAFQPQLHVVFIEGQMSMLRNIEPSFPVTVNEQEGRGYVIECGEGQNLVKLLVPSDYQLLLGTNAIELEEIFERDLKRIPFNLISDTTFQKSRLPDVIDKDSLIFVSNGTYLNNQISSEVYLKKVNNQYIVSLDTMSPSRLVKNILLTGVFNKEIPMDLTINKYGNINSSLFTSLQQYITYCKNEECTLYVGLKHIKDGKVSATLFSLNRKMAYNHMLKVEVPLSIFLHGEGVIKGTLYPYTPLQVYSKELFIKTINI